MRWTERLAKEETMRANRIFGIVAFFLLVAAFEAVPAIAGMNVNVSIGVPAVVVAEPPEMILVPDTMVYFAPGVEAELFFYRGSWYTHHGHRWYRANSYKGPWAVAPPRAVPVAFGRLPRDYRKVYVRERHVPYGQLKKHWKHHERERRWGRRAAHSPREHEHRHHREKDGHRGR